MDVVTCENCGRGIGKLETPRVYGDHVVCPECHARLAPQALGYAAPAPPAPHSHVQQVEMTAKGWKFKQLVGAIIMFPGLFAVIAGIFAINSPQVNHSTAVTILAAGGIGFLLGMALYVAGRLGAWWHHG